jgi:hypothetical protein
MVWYLQVPYSVERTEEWNKGAFFFNTRMIVAFLQQPASEQNDQKLHHQ